MDDLKLFAKDDNELKGLLNIVKYFSDDICMSFGLDKCAKVTFKKGRILEAPLIDLDFATKIRELEHDEAYKYLGISEGDGIQHSQMKEKVRKEYYRRVRLVLNTELNSKKQNISHKHLGCPCGAIQL